MSDDSVSERPQVLLIDIRDEGKSLGDLRGLGLNADSGTFGRPYRVGTRDEWLPVISLPELPGYNESDIIVVDLATPGVVPGPVGDDPPRGIEVWAANARYGTIDPRPEAMQRMRPYSLRLLKKGGGFIVFADSSPRQSYAMGTISRGWVDVSRQVEASNWDFLTPGILSLQIQAEVGRQVTPVQDGGPLGAVLKRHVKDARFFCHFIGQRPQWRPLALNKSGGVVSGVMMVGDGDPARQGFILLLPQLADKAAFLKDLFQDALPEVFPHLFPDAEGLKWVQRPEYEQDRVLRVRSEIIRVERESQETLAKLGEELEERRQEYWFLDDLLTGTDEKLVKAVAHCLRLLGFDVTDCDAQAGGGPLNEDLRIEGEPLVLVEVKGVGGLPADEEALQAWKYIAPRMKETNRFDVRALAVINHQRHLPPLQRENVNTFRDDIITNAMIHDFGLLTTWDLWRLTRGFIENEWRHEDVADLMSLNGRIDPVPAHYEFLGSVHEDGIFPDKKVIGFESIADLSVGDRVAFELPTRFREQEVTSMHVEREAVEAAAAGMKVSIEAVLTKEEARKGVRMFKVRK